MSTIDAFIYSDEIDILKLRIKYLKSSIDTFCMIVGSHYFTGERKENNFSNELQLANTEGVHLHVIIVDFTKDLKWRLYSIIWPRRLPKHSEDLQRQFGCAELTQVFSEDDVIIFSDVDEIPSLDFLEKYVTGEVTPEKQIRLKMHNFYYNNQLKDTNPWVGSFVARLKDLDSNLLRDVDCMTTENLVGWHLSYMGNEENKIKKLKTFAHQEYSKPALANWDQTLENIKAGRDLFGRHSSFENINSLDEIYDERMITLFSETNYFSGVE